MFKETIQLVKCLVNMLLKLCILKKNDTGGFVIHTLIHAWSMMIRRYLHTILRTCCIKLIDSKQHFADWNIKYT